MTISKQSAQAYIEACMRKGAECDRLSDKYNAEGDHHRGAYWGKIAMLHYTEAQKFSQLWAEEPDGAVTPQSGPARPPR